MRSVLHFFDKLEDGVRGSLSRVPILYAFIAGVGMVLFWRGVWHTADIFSLVFSDPSGAYYPLTSSQILDGPVSILVSIVLLLLTGLFVSTFIGNEIIISGLRGEKKIAEKTEGEVRGEIGSIARIERELRAISVRLEKIEKKIT